MTPLPNLQVFLCHSSADKSAVRDLYRRLADDGMSPWFDEEDLLPGQDWNHEIRMAVRSSDAVVVCLSRSSINKRGFVQKEIKFALDAAEEQPQATIFLIPLKLEECAVPEQLQKWQWVNYFEKGGYEKLKRALDQVAVRLEEAEQASNVELARGAAASIGTNDQDPDAGVHALTPTTSTHVNQRIASLRPFRHTWRNLSPTPLFVLISVCLVALGSFSLYQNLVVLPSFKNPQIFTDSTFLITSRRAESGIVNVPRNRAFLLNFDIPPTNFLSYDVSILNENGVQRFSLPLSAAEAKNVVQILLPVGALEEGRYMLVINGVQVGEGMTGEVVRYPFELKFETEKENLRP